MLGARAGFACCCDGAVVFVSDVLMALDWLFWLRACPLFFSPAGINPTAVLLRVASLSRRVRYACLSSLTPASAALLPRCRVLPLAKWIRTGPVRPASRSFPFCAFVKSQKQWIPSPRPSPPLRPSGPCLHNQRNSHSSQTQ